MKRDFPLYEGDGVIRRPAGPASLLEDAGRAAFEGPFVDVAAIDRLARRERALTLGSLFSRLLEAVDASVRRAKAREVQTYLAAATDLADLERRLQRIGTERRDLLVQG